MIKILYIEKCEVYRVYSNISCWLDLPQNGFNYHKFYSEKKKMSFFKPFCKMSLSSLDLLLNDFTEDIWKMSFFRPFWKMVWLSMDLLLKWFFQKHLKNAFFLASLEDNITYHGFITQMIFPKANMK